MKNKKLNLGLKITCVALATPVCTALAFSQIDTTRTYKRCWEVNNRFFRNIVEENPDFINVPLNKISMLGSHDSLSNDINIYSKPDVNKWGPESAYVKLNSSIKGTIVRLSKAQNENIYDQLSAGIRLIDVRISHINGVYYNVHGLISNTLEHNLKLILKWLDENPGEFIMFNIVRFYKASNETEVEAWENLKTFIESVTYNNKNLFDYDYTLAKKPNNCAFKDITYDEICEKDESGNRKAGAVISYTPDWSQYIEVPESIWCIKHNQKFYMPEFKADSDSYFSKCPEMPTAKDVIFTMKFLYNQLANEMPTRNNNCLKTFQIQTAPSAKDIPGSFAMWSLIDSAHDINPYILRKAGIDWNTYLNTIPIVICDYSTCNDNNFCTDMLKMLSDRNKTLNP